MPEVCHNKAWHDSDSWSTRLQTHRKEHIWTAAALRHIRAVTVINNAIRIFYGGLLWSMLIIPKVKVKEVRLRIKVDSGNMVVREDGRQRGGERGSIFFKEECTKYSSVSLSSSCVLSVSLPGPTTGRTLQPHLENDRLNIDAIQELDFYWFLSCTLLFHVNSSRRRACRAWIFLWGEWTPPFLSGFQWYLKFSLKAI